MKKLIKIREKRKNKKYEEFWSKVRDLIRSITKNSDDYNENYMKVKVNSDGDLPLNKTIETYDATIIVGLFFMKITNINCKFSLMDAYMNYK